MRILWIYRWDIAKTQSLSRIIDRTGRRKDWGCIKEWSRIQDVDDCDRLGSIHALMASVAASGSSGRLGDENVRWSQKKVEVTDSTYVIFGTQWSFLSSKNLGTCVSPCSSILRRLSRCASSTAVLDVVAFSMSLCWMASVNADHSLVNRSDLGTAKAWRRCKQAGRTALTRSALAPLSEAPSWVRSCARPWLRQIVHAFYQSVGRSDE